MFPGSPARYEGNRMISRRHFLQTASALALAPLACHRASGEIPVNDVHSGLNPTPVKEILRPVRSQELPSLIRSLRRQNLTPALCGARHAMGGQQFASHQPLLDLRSMNRVISFDQDLGLIETEAGISWPQLMDSYLKTQGDRSGIWSIPQKQTGADDLTIGGTLSANAHGRSLRLPPIIGGVESFELVDSQGQTKFCSRSSNPELFSLAIGGYGLFGVISKATLRLARRQKVRRSVDILRTAEAVPKLEEAADQGALYGDYQFCIDETSPDFLQFGVCSCYHPVPDATLVPEARGLNQDGWLRLLKLAYTDRRRAFAEYVSFYRSTHGQVYWSDGHQFGPYLPDYAKELRAMTAEPSSLMITELYVPRFLLADFLRDAAQGLRLSRSPLIYGTLRLIQADRESFLPWARQDYACVIFNLLVSHDPAGIDSARRTFRSLIDLAIDRGGSYYLTYHRYATARQLETCYPQFRRFLQLKKQYDPDEFFQSDWYRHCRDLLAGG